MQVAKTLQTTLGLHDEDVAFFLAADTRELYQEVVPFAQNQPIPQPLAIRTA